MRCPLPEFFHHINQASNWRVMEMNIPRGEDILRPDQALSPEENTQSRLDVCFASNGAYRFCELQFCCGTGAPGSVCGFDLKLQTSQRATVAI